MRAEMVWTGHKLRAGANSVFRAGRSLRHMMPLLLGDNGLSALGGGEGSLAPGGARRRAVSSSTPQHRPLPYMSLTALFLAALGRLRGGGAKRRVALLPGGGQPDLAQCPN